MELRQIALVQIDWILQRNELFFLEGLVGQKVPQVLCFQVEAVDCFKRINIAGGFDSNNMRMLVKGLEENGTMVLAISVLCKMQSEKCVQPQWPPSNRARAVLFDIGNDVSTN